MVKGVREGGECGVSGSETVVEFGFGVFTSYEVNLVVLCWVAEGYFIGSDTDDGAWVFC